nr:hypothetical protein [Tanacetum cinerariifolium]
MTTLAEFIIVAGADNRPLMLDKNMYDSWKSRMELYIEGKENEGIILNSVNNDPLICPTVEENGVTRVKREMLQAQEETMQLDRERLLNVITLKTKNLNAYNFDCDDVSLAKMDLMANLSSCDLCSLLEIINAGTPCLETTSFKYCLVNFSIESVSFIGLDQLSTPRLELVVAYSVPFGSRHPPPLLPFPDDNEFHSRSHSAISTIYVGHVQLFLIKNMLHALMISEHNAFRAVQIMSPHFESKRYSSKF